MEVIILHDFFYSSKMNDQFHGMTKFREGTSYWKRGVLVSYCDDLVDYNHDEES